MRATLYLQYIHYIILIINIIVHIIIIVNKKIIYLKYYNVMDKQISANIKFNISNAVLKYVSLLVELLYYIIILAS